MDKPKGKTEFTKVAMLSFSQTGNTLKVGRNIVTGLEQGGLEVQHLRFLDRGDWNPANAGIIGVGCPVFENIPADNVTAYLENEPKLDLRGKLGFVYVTAGGSPAGAAWRLTQTLTKRGAKVIGSLQIRGTTRVPTMFGFFPDRPDRDDLVLAEHFGRAIAAFGRDSTEMPKAFVPTKKSSSPLYDVVGPVLNRLKKLVTPPPKCDHDKCNLCGICTTACPTGNHSIEDGKVRTSDTCIVCYHCWSICPQNAISIRFSPGNGWIERTIYSEEMERRFSNIRPDERYGPNLYRDVLTRRIKLKYNRKNPTAKYTIAK